MNAFISHIVRWHEAHRNLLDDIGDLFLLVQCSLLRSISRIISSCCLICLRDCSHCLHSSFMCCSPMPCVSVKPGAISTLTITPASVIWNCVDGNVGCGGASGSPTSFRLFVLMAPSYR